MYELKQYENGRVYLHGVNDSVSKLIEFYYKYRKQFGAMVVIDTTDGKQLASLGSIGINHN